MRKKSKILIAAGIALLLIAVIAAVLMANRSDNGTGEQTGQNGEAVSFDHIHGMGYTNEGSLVVPAHDGLRIYSEGIWQKSDSVPHDYMGFSMTDTGFYSSGHPAEGSDLPEPLGLIKSDAFGTEVEPLVLQGEVDFHGMAAGYHSKAIYVFNPHPNSMMDAPGLYYSLDEGATWTSSAANGIKGSIASMAVHPDDEKSVAFGMDQGLFLSNDYGSTFKQATTKPAGAIAYTFDGKMIVSETSEMLMFDLTSLESEPISIPKLAGDESIIFIAVHPESPEKIAYATSSSNMYESNDGGENWSAIVESGKGINTP